jgi:hypothetical protein
VIKTWTTLNKRKRIIEMLKKKRKSKKKIQKNSSQTKLFHSDPHQDDLIPSMYALKCKQEELKKLSLRAKGLPFS